MLGDGLHDVPPGKIAAVVTYLEMTVPAPPRPVPPPAGVTIEPVACPDLDVYRSVFRRVGGQDWLWFSRLAMSDAALADILHDPAVELYHLMAGTDIEGLLELDFRQPGTCELAFFGVTRALIGTGAGRFLMNHAIARAWARPIGCLHVHTCTMDSPGALDFYRRSGFTPMRQAIEIADDPRLTGALPTGAGAHVPVFGG